LLHFLPKRNRIFSRFLASQTQKQRKKKKKTGNRKNGGSDSGTSATEIRDGLLLGPPGLPSAMVQALTLPLPELRLRILHFGAPYLRPLRHAPIRARVPPRRPQSRAHRPHQPRLRRLCQPQHQARRCRRLRRQNARSATRAPRQDRAVPGLRGSLARRSQERVEAEIRGRFRERDLADFARYVSRGVEGIYNSVSLSLSM
jgi:hypothetical protein